MSSLEAAEVSLPASQRYILPVQEAKKHPNASSEWGRKKGRFPKNERDAAFLWQQRDGAKLAPDFHPSRL